MLDGERRDGAVALGQLELVDLRSANDLDRILRADGDLGAGAMDALRIFAVRAALLAVFATANTRDEIFDVPVALGFAIAVVRLLLGGRLARALLLAGLRSLRGVRVRQARHLGGLRLGLV